MDQEIKSPKWSLTVAFLLVAVVSFFLILNQSVTADSGFSTFGYALLLTGNVGFWGLVYRVSRHAAFYLKGQPKAGFFRIVLTGSFAIAFIFLFSFGYSRVKNPAPSVGEEDAFTKMNELAAPKDQK